MIKKVTVIAIILILVCISAYAGSSKSPEKILFIGSSLMGFNELDNHFEQLASSATPPLVIEADRYAMSYGTLKKLWGDTYMHGKMEKGNYDLVVLQEDIPEIIDRDVKVFHEYTRIFVEKIKELGANPVLFMAWSYKRLRWISMEEIAQAHHDIAKELGLTVAPVGLAMQNAIAERPDLDMLHYDEEHPSIHGTYLSACVIYATIFGRSPLGSSYLPTWRGGVTEEEAVFLQRIAWETVQEYQAQQ